MNGVPFLLLLLLVLLLRLPLPISPSSYKCVDGFSFANLMHDRELPLPLPPLQLPLCDFLLLWPLVYLVADVKFFDFAPEYDAKGAASFEVSDDDDVDADDEIVLAKFTEIN